MARPIWKGYITFGLVNIPVVLYSAEKHFDIQLKMLDSRDKSRIHYERVSEKTGKKVPWHDVAKGYEYDENHFVMLKETDLKKIAGENAKTINIENFIQRASLDPMYFEKPYYLVPEKKGEKGYVILRDILNDTKKVAIAKVIIHTREYLSVLMPHDNAIILNIIRYSQELRDLTEFDFPTGNLKTYKISAKEMEIAKQLVDSMTSKWKPDDYQDEYRVALQKWIEEKIHHAKKPHAKMKSRSSRKSGNVIDFVDLLKQSLQKKHPPKAKKSKPKLKKSHAKKAG